MKIYLLPVLVLSIFLMSIISYSQDSTNLHPIDEFTYTSSISKVVHSETGTKSNDSNSFTAYTSSSTHKTNSSGSGAMQGTLSVSLTGAANYTVPIAVPPGVNGVQPTVGIHYNSQSGNGIAGWGWNITGTSGITRIPATKYHDGIADPVDFDPYDRYALDGQRLLLKSGTYGGDGATYETENYTNLKITSHGVSKFGAAYGPSYFRVYYPDGSFAVYGGTSSEAVSVMEWALHYRDNPQGIRIWYAYTLSDNVLSLDKISYGSKGTTTPIHEIQFQYQQSERFVQGFVYGVAIVRKDVLKEIKVVGNGQAYRNYALTYDGTTAGYHRLIGIEEKTGNNTQTHSPIHFTYPDSTPGIQHSLTTTADNLGITNINQQTVYRRILQSSYKHRYKREI